MNKNIFRAGAHRLNMNIEELSKVLAIDKSILYKIITYQNHSSPFLLKKLDLLLDKSVQDDYEDYYFGVRPLDPLSRLGEIEEIIRINQENNQLNSLIFYFFNYKDYIKRYALENKNLINQLKMDRSIFYLMNKMFSNIKNYGKPGVYLDKKGQEHLKYLMQLY
ncbi:MAG: hypothetical protein E7272_07665 [Pseudobutyrivibrio ruminis]|uniref:Uncharacterized protein n=1 Tax=Pseudobutyrivibrio ruminis TaxID=46206 RepID=A0A927YMD7_9FIRM|nr:hypothetical protein [Pseudobutyrivibrio ruminis]